jgi:hypothetical protein
MITHTNTTSAALPLPHVLALPTELLDAILLDVGPFDLAPLSSTCHALHTAIYAASNSHIWRSHYLCLPLDDPRRCVTPLLHPLSDEIADWKDRLTRVLRARAVARVPSICKEHERTEVLRTLLELACCVPSRKAGGIADAEDTSANLLWVAATLRMADLVDHELWELTDEEHQLRAKLHTMCGLTQRDLTPAAR